MASSNMFLLLTEVGHPYVFQDSLFNIEKNEVNVKRQFTPSSTHLFITERRGSFFSSYEMAFDYPIDNKFSENVAAKMDIRKFLIE